MMDCRYKKITVKVGSNVLTRSDGTLNVPRIAHLVDQIAVLHSEGVEIVLVSSGAVASGKAVLTPARKYDDVSSRQLWAALGQVKLINRYSDFLREHNLVCAQVLTTKENFSSRKHYLNMKNCITTLLENKVIPIVNENDTISVTELMFTDNDELSGLMATLAASEALIILTNVDGVYSGAPGEEGSEIIEEIGCESSGPDIRPTGLKSEFGRGGMITKLRIARKVAAGGISVHIANGNRENILIELLDSGTHISHTHFIPEKKAPSGMKNWIAYSDSFAKSRITINHGACIALFSHKAVSLLPVGVVSTAGPFKKGDLLRIFDETGRYLGIGRAQYGSDKLEREAGAARQKPLIHYDYLYLENNIKNG
jgi:glutamate 5-kinase